MTPGPIPPSSAGRVRGARVGTRTVAWGTMWRPPHEQTGRPLVCVVDDIADNRVLVTAVLERAGMGVVTARDGVELDALLEGGVAPDIFLIDLVLPGESGESIHARLRSDERWRSCPMLAYTAKAMAGAAARGLALGFDGYLVKPIDIYTLPGVLRAHWRRVRREDPP